MAQVVEGLSSNLETLNSIPSTTKKKKNFHRTGRLQKDMNTGSLLQSLY
jgi:hypothetical protein